MVEIDDVAGSDILLQAMMSIAAPRSCRYAAGPLTSGRAFLTVGLSGDRDSEVDGTMSKLEANNRRKLSEFADELRRKGSSPVIDPGLLQVPGWTGADYSVFFLRVINVLCYELWLLPEWEYSVGVTKEVVFALQRGIRCVGRDGDAITPSLARALVGNAVDEVRSFGRSADKLVERVRQLHQLEAALD